MTLTDQVVSRVKHIAFDQLPEQVIMSAKRCMLDYYGVVLAGAVVNKSRIGEFLESATFGETTVYGLNIKCDIYSAVLANSFNAHTIELDDGHRFGMMHMGAPIISAVFAIAENYEVSNEQILRAIVCGYDVAIALSRKMQPGHKLKGYHATGTCCTVGAAMAISLLLNYDEDKIRSTLAMSATSAAGILEVIDDSSELKPYNIAHAAIAGLSAALFGKVGFSGPIDVIGGKRGFFAVLSQEKDFEKISNSEIFQEDQYAITEIYTKPYAACRHCHPAIEAAVNAKYTHIAMGNEFDPSELEEISIGTYSLAIRGHEHTAIYGASSAKMSIPYSVAAALVTDKVGIDAYTLDMISDTRTAETMKKITIHIDPELDAFNPQKRGAIVELKFKNGETSKARVDYPLGEPEHMMSNADLEKKFITLATYAGKTQESIQAAIDMIWEFDHSKNCIFKYLH